MIKIFKRFYRFIFKYKWLFLLFVLTLTITAILENLTPYAYKLLVESIPQKSYQGLMAALLLFVGLKVFSNWLDALSRFLGDKVLFPASRDARIKIFRQVQDLDFAFHINKNTGSLISAFKRGDGAFFSFFDDLNAFFKIFVSLIVAVYFFSKITPVISILMIGIFFGNIIFSWFLIKRNIKQRSLFNQAEDDISGIITDNLLNYETVKFFAKEEKEEKRLRERFTGWIKALWGYANTFRLMDICIGTFSNLGIFIIYYVVVKKIIIGEIGVGDFVLIASFTTGFYYRFFEMLYKLRSMAKNVIDISNYFSILDQEVLVKDPQNPRKIENIKGEITFENVDFNYVDNPKNVLNDFTLKIESGESVAFVGRSGAGKTTIIKMLLRFYDVSRGRILVDGVDIKEFTKSSLRSLMGVVPQEPILFNNTIGYNIAYGNDNAKPEDINKSAKMANLHDFINRLPLKYETPVGERGIKLSGGQKQRLAIARMILSNPKIIIFDEATSNLDSESEKLIQDSLWKIAKGRTVLIVAHRFSTVRDANRIVVLEEGKIVEMGSHKELISDTNGLYYYLWNLQTKGGIEQADVDLIDQVE